MLLEAALARDRARRRVLDIGTGTGILAIAAPGSASATVLAIDIDPDAVAGRRANAERNGVRRPRARRARRRATLTRRAGAARGGESADRRPPGAGRAVRALVAPGGALVLGGILDAEADRVAGALAGPRLPPRGVRQPRGLDHPRPCVMRRFTLPPDRLVAAAASPSTPPSRVTSRACCGCGPGDTVLAADGAGRDYTVRLETSARGRRRHGHRGRPPASPESPLRHHARPGRPQGRQDGGHRPHGHRARRHPRPARCSPSAPIVRLEPARWRDRARAGSASRARRPSRAGAPSIPEIEPPRPLAGVPGDEPADLALCLWEGGGEPLGTDAGGPPARPAPRTLIVGPEGGLPSPRSTPRGRAASTWSSRSGRGSCGPRRRGRRSWPSCSRASVTCDDRGRLGALRGRGRRGRPRLGPETRPRRSPRRTLGVFALIVAPGSVEVASIARSERRPTPRSRSWWPGSTSASTCTRSRASSCHEVEMTPARTRWPTACCTASRSILAATGSALWSRPRPPPDCRDRAGRPPRGPPDRRRVK